MPLQASTQWDGLGHIFDRGLAWNGRPAEKVVTSEGDLVTGIEHTRDRFVSRGVLLDVGAVLGAGLGTPGELPDGYPITADEPRRHDRSAGRDRGRGPGRPPSRAHRPARPRPSRGLEGLRGRPLCGALVHSAGWLHSHEIAGIATDTWGFEVRPNEFDVAFQPLHQIAIPNMGLSIGELWDLDALAADCAADRCFEFFLAAAPIPFTGAVGAPVNPVAVK